MGKKGRATGKQSVVVATRNKPPQGVNHQSKPALVTHRELRLRCCCGRLLPRIIVEVGKGTNAKCPRCARQVDIKVMREHDGTTFVDEHWGNRPNESDNN